MATAATRPSTATFRWRLSPSLYRLMMVVHVTSSLAWMGAEAILLALAIIGINTGNPETVRAVYVAMGLFGPWFYIPLSLVALISGVVLSLGTKWGLVTYYWVAIKLAFNLALAIGGTFAVMGMVTAAASSVTGVPASALTAEIVGGRRFSMVGAFSVGLALLSIATILSYYKPWGRIRWPRRSPRARIQ